MRGEAGVGKSALIEAAVAQAGDGVRVLRARGYESDTEIPYAGLLELVTPLLTLRERLPAAQRDALASAFALEPPTPHDRLAVPAGLLGLLARAAERRPLLAVVDDVHWLDDASRDAIMFAARRLVAGGVGMLLAVREGPRAPPTSAASSSCGCRAWSGRRRWPSCAAPRRGCRPGRPRRSSTRPPATRSR